MAHPGLADFSNFHLVRHSVYDLAPNPETGQGLIPEMAGLVDVELGQQPDPQELGLLVRKLGSSAVLRENEPSGRVPLALACEWAERSGSQEALNRNLADPEQPTPWNDGAVVFASGGVANNSDRVAELLNGVAPTEVYVATGQRIMTSATEVRNPNVVRWIEAESGLTVPSELSDEELVRWAKDNTGLFPTESQYAADVQRPQLESAGHTVHLRPYDTTKGSEITDRVADDERHRGLFDTNVVSAEVANGGVSLSVQLLRSGLQNPDARIGADFSKRLFVLTDEHTRLAETPDQLGDPLTYQDPNASIRQTAVTARYMVIARGLLGY